MKIFQFPTAPNLGGTIVLFAPLHDSKDFTTRLYSFSPTDIKFPDIFNIRLRPVLEVFIVVVHQYS